MKANEFISLYRSDSLIQTLAEGIRMSHSKCVRIKGLHGSLDAVIFSSVFKSIRANHLVVLSDKEEASYFLNDLQHLLDEKEVFFFPMS